MIDVSIIIVSYNSSSEIQKNLESMRKHIKSLNYEVLIVNNYAGDRRLKEISDCYDNVRIIEAGANLGFGRANNLGLLEARGEYILFVNPDVLFLSDINKLVEMLQNNPETGLTGPVTLDGDGKLLPSCGEFPNVHNFISYHLFLNTLFPKIKWWGNFPMKYFDFNCTSDVDWISGAFILGRKSVVDKIGGFDRDFFMYGEDIDICWRLKKLGYRIIFSDKASIIHTVGHSVQQRSPAKARMLAESSSILWNKHYDSVTRNRLFKIMRFGSSIRKTGWQLLKITGISKRDNVISFYDTLISESDNYLRG